MSERPLVCIIGAGSSGITVAKTLYQHAIPFDCFETGDRVGGLWAAGNTNGRPAPYRSLRMNTSRRRSAYADFPMPDRYPDFPHHEQMAEYFNAYVDHFGFRHTITFNTTVKEATREPDGLWRVTLTGGARRYYDALVVANGHHWDARWPAPALPGRFDGTVLHSHCYVDNAPFVDQNVVVLGIGNSAADIAVEISFVARRTFLSTRHGAYVIPKYLLGKPLDHWNPNPRLPWRLKQALRERILRAVVGRMEDYGLPRPDHRLLEAHPTVSSYLLPRVAEGHILPKPTISALLGDHVRFADGSVEAADALIYCTGYNITFPFFSPTFITARENVVPLYRRVFKPEIANLAFIGLLQPLGALMPVAEAQARWLAAYLCGHYALPTPREMEADMEREQRARHARFVPSTRHTMEVDTDVYLYRLAQERKRGAARARCQGGQPPIARRARARRAEPPDCTAYQQV